jgi:hypothetical protein
MIAGVADPSQEELAERETEEPTEAQCFDVHEWLLGYLAREHDEVVQELVGVPFS